MICLCRCWTLPGPYLLSLLWQRGGHSSFSFDLYYSPFPVLCTSGERYSEACPTALSGEANTEHCHKRQQDSQVTALHTASRYLYLRDVVASMKDSQDLYHRKLAAKEVIYRSQIWFYFRKVNETTIFAFQRKNGYGSLLWLHSHTE